MRDQFSTKLRRLRKNAQLTNKELGRLAGVPESLISGLQNNNRRIGEYQGRKIGTALGLAGDELEQFVMDAIDTCTEKVLAEAKPYPAILLNLLPVQLHGAGVKAENIYDLTVTGGEHENEVLLTLASGSKLKLKTQLLCV